MVGGLYTRAILVWVKTCQTTHHLLLSTSAFIRMPSQSYTLCGYSVTEIIREGLHAAPQLVKHAFDIHIELCLQLTASSWSSQSTVGCWM